MNLLDLARAALPRPNLESNVDPVRQWRIRYPNAETMTVLFSPASTRADVADVYRGATIEPVPEVANLPATPKQVDELRALIAEVLSGAQEADQIDALVVARRDPGAALLSLRALQNELQENAKWSIAKEAP